MRSTDEGSPVSSSLMNLGAPPLAQMPAPPQFVVKVHSRCDLACDHCYVYEAVDQSWRGRPMVISDEVAAQTGQRIAEHWVKVGISLDGDRAAKEYLPRRGGIRSQQNWSRGSPVAVPANLWDGPVGRQVP